MAKGNNSHKKEVKKPKQQKPKSLPTRRGPWRGAPNLLAFADFVTPGAKSAHAWNDEAGRRLRPMTARTASLRKRTTALTSEECPIDQNA